MQLSVPMPVSPAPSSSGSTGANLGLAGDAGSTTNTDTPADSFESLLSDSPDGDQPKDDAAPDAVATADLLAAALWLPLTPLAPTQPPSAPDLELGFAAEGDPAETSTTELPADSTTDSTPSPSTPAAVPATPFCISPRVSHLAGSEPKPVEAQDVAQGRALGLERTPGRLPKVAASVAQTVAATRQAAVNPEAGVIPEALLASGTKLPQPAVAPLVSGDVINADPTAVVEAGDLTPAVTADVTLPATDDASEKRLGEQPNLIVPAGLRGEIVNPAGVKRGPREKIAAASDGSEAVGRVAKNVREKYFLDPVSKGVATVEEKVGIAVANPELAMSDTSSRPKSATIVESVTSLAFNGGTVGTATVSVDAPAPVAAVRQALAAVINAVETLERRADVQQTSVDLNFKVGSENLGLRVELREGTVHTTFRTESAEMNGALAREWHTVVHPVLGPAFRIAEPVFNSSTSGNGDSPAGHAGTGSHPHQQHGEKPASNFASALSREFYDTGATDSAPVTATPAANSSQLLNALA